MALIRALSGSGGSGSNDMQVMAISCASSNTMYYAYIYKNTDYSLLASGNRAYNSVGNIVTDTNIKADLTAQHQITVTAMNGYYLYAFYTNDNPGTSTNGIVSYGQNGSVVFGTPTQKSPVLIVSKTQLFS